MPWCLRFPPMVAVAYSQMRPMCYSNIPALCDHSSAANRACSRQTWLRFSTFSFNQSEFHLYSPMTNPRSIDHSIERLFREEARAHQLFAGSCFSSALARGSSLSLVVIASQRPQG